MENIKKHPGIVIGIATFIFIFWLLTMINTTFYPYDSYLYNRLSNSFLKDGDFSIFNFEESIRGIIFPLLLYPFNRLAHLLLGFNFMGWRILISLLSAIFTVTFPYFFKSFGKIHWIPVHLILMLITWWGLFLVPLSDLVAVYLLMFGLLCVQKAYEQMDTQTGRYSKLTPYGILLVSGILFYAAYNTRTIYLFAFPFILLIIFANRKKGIGKSLLAVLAICVGVILLGSVQGVSNRYLYGAFSMAVNTAIGGFDNLFLGQLAGGIPASLYETYMGEMGPASYIYRDPVGSIILQSEGGWPYTFGEYIKIVIRYPVEMLGIYARSFLALLNPITGGGYVYSRSNSRLVMSLINYSMLFVTANFFVRKLFRTNDDTQNLKTRILELSIEQKTAILSYLTLLVPFILIIPGQVEERFAIPFWLLVYGVLTYIVDWKDELAHYKRNLALSIGIYCLGFACLMATLTSIYAHNPHGMLLSIFHLNR
jgi:hypothetical protein